MLMSCYLVTALLAFRRARTEEGAGHGLVGAALLCVPATPVLLALTGQPPVYLRHLAVVPTILLGMTLLTVSLLRRRR